MPYVREYTEDREITAWFLLDLSPSVDFGTARHGPPEADRPDRLRDHARPAADAPGQPGRCGPVRRSGRPDDPGRPAAGSRSCGSSTRCCASRGWPARRSPTSRRCSTPGSRAIKRRSLVFVISDFISEPGWERSLDLLDRRHEVLAVRLVDPREVRAARRRSGHPRGRRDRRAAATWTPATPPSGAGSRRRRVDREAAIAEAFRRAGVDAVSLSTDEDLVRGHRPHGGPPAPSAEALTVTFAWPQALLAPAAHPARAAGLSRARPAPAPQGRGIRWVRVRSAPQGAARVVRLGRRGSSPAPPVAARSSAP